MGPSEKAGEPLEDNVLATLKKNEVCPTYVQWQSIFFLGQRSLFGQNSDIYKTLKKGQIYSKEVFTF